MPAVATLRPVPLRWEAGNDPTHGNLLAQLNLDPSSQISAAIVSSPVRYLRVVSPDEKLFIKIVPAALARRMMRGEKLAVALRNRGSSVIAIIRDVCKVSDNSSAFIYQYIEAPYLQIGETNVNLVAAALARLHAELSSAAETEFAVRATRSVRGAARRVALELLHMPRLDEEISKDLQQFLSIDHTIPGRGPQRVHNDLHTANVFMNASGEPLFLDFEEMSWSHFPPAFDVAKMIERFILAEPTIDDAQAHTLAERFLRAYNTASGHEVTGPDILLALRWHLGFAWTRLRAQLREESMMHPEVLKFRLLSRITKSRTEWLSALGVAER